MRGGHLLSKHRFIAAQMDAFLDGNRWLDHARHANAMADDLARRLREAGIVVVFPVEANLVFAILPQNLNARLKAAGATYYVRGGHALPAGLKRDDDVLVRLVTSFQTHKADIDRFAEVIGKSL